MSDLFTISNTKIQTPKLFAFEFESHEFKNIPSLFPPSHLLFDRHRELRHLRPPSEATTGL